MTWSCPHSPLTRAFGGSIHLPYWPGNFSGKEEDFLRESLNLSTLAPDPSALRIGELSNRDRDRALGCWLRLVTVYSQRSATLQVDKLNALAGVSARCYAPLLGPGYFAGMWEYGLLRQLAWETSKFYDSRQYLRFTVTRPLLDTGLSRAPSWSWASVEGGMVKYDKFPRVEKVNDRRIQEEEKEWMSEVVTIATMPRFGMANPFGEIKPGSGRITLRTKLKRAWRHPSSHSIFRKSCAPTPSDELSDKKSIPLSKRSQEQCGPFTEDVSPFKRLLRRTGPLPPDSDSEYDSESETMEPLIAPLHATAHPTGHSRDQDRTWWWLVSASLDQITAEESYPRAHDDEWRAQKNYEVEHIDPFVVYMLPLVSTIRQRPHRHYPGKTGLSGELVQGLLLVKDKEAMNKKWDFEGRTEKGNVSERGREVLFKRIGRFSGCPKREFENVPIRNVTIL